MYAFAALVAGIWKYDIYHVYNLAAKERRSGQLLYRNNNGFMMEAEDSGVILKYSWSLP